MNILLKFESASDCEAVLSGIRATNRLYAKGVIGTPMAAALARATVYGPIPDGEPCPQPLPQHTPNIKEICVECLRFGIHLRQIDGKFICDECARYRYPGL